MLSPLEPSRVVFAVCSRLARRGVVNSNGGYCRTRRACNYSAAHNIGLALLLVFVVSYFIFNKFSFTADTHHAKYRATISVVCVCAADDQAPICITNNAQHTMRVLWSG